MKSKINQNLLKFFTQMTFKASVFIHILKHINCTSEKEANYNPIYFYLHSQKIKLNYSGSLFGETIAPNLVPWVFKKKIWSEIVKDDICLEGEYKQNMIFKKKICP